MMGMFNPTSPNPTPLDKITPVSIKDTYFYQNDLSHIDDNAKFDTETNADKKMVFDLVHLYESMVGNSYDLSTSELHMMQDNFGPLLALIKSSKFENDVKTFKPIVETINKIQFEGYDSYAFDSIVSLTNSLANDNGLLNAINADSTKYEIKFTPQSSPS